MLRNILYNQCVSNITCTKPAIECVNIRGSHLRWNLNSSNAKIVFDEVSIGMQLNTIHNYYPHCHNSVLVANNGTTSSL